MSPLPQRENHTGGFLVGVVLIFITIGIIVAEFFFLLSWNGLASGIQADNSVPETVIAVSETQTFTDDVRGLTLQYPKGWIATTTQALEEPSSDFVAFLSESETVVPSDPVLAGVYVWRVTNELGLDAFANVVRSNLENSGETIQEDQPVNGVYVFASHKRIEAEGQEPWTGMHAVYLIPEPIIGGSEGAYIIVDATDNLDSFGKTIEMVGNQILPSLKKI